MPDESVPRAQYERDLFNAVMRTAELESALRTAHRRLTEARALLTPGMRAGTSEACALLHVSAHDAQRALQHLRAAGNEDIPPLDRPITVGQAVAAAAAADHHGGWDTAAALANELGAPLSVADVAKIEAEL